ncbi:MAG: class I SAM-dependent methyltransferase [Planctomycetota bacterium]|nr:class I SAM-dependent methyltransferase [Planctomycetota bacterium]
MSSETAIGAASYDADEFGNDWWLARARDKAHQRAYQAIADAVAEHTTKAKVVIDYACGSGLLLARLAQSLPKTQLIGLDESVGMLDAARAWLGQEVGAEKALQVRLLRTALPDFDLKLPKADAVVFSFPDFRCDLDGKVIKALSKIHPEEWAWSKLASRQIRKQAVQDPDCDDSDDVFDADRLFYERLATRNMRKLVRKGGLLVRVDYALGKRKEWIDAYVGRHDWSLGSWLPDKLTGADRRKARFAEPIKAKYFKSSVIRDVHAQTGSDDCLDGGFIISALKAV